VVRKRPPESGFRIPCVNNAVVVAGDGEDRRGIVAINLVELIVIVGGFAEVVDDISKMEEERRPVGGLGVAEVRDHLVGNLGLVKGALHVAGVTDRVEDELAGLCNGVDYTCAFRSVYLGQGENGFYRRHEGHGDS
jgi:hypothetical protein